MALKFYRHFRSLGENNLRILRLYQIGFWGSIVAISVLAFLKGSALPPTPQVGDKLNHILAFLYLTIAADFAHPKLSIKARVVILVIFGLFIEVVQYFLPWRSFEWLDLAVDFGAILVIAITLSALSTPEPTASELSS